MKNLKKIQFVTGTIVTGLFLFHVVVLTLLLKGMVHYHVSFKYTGIALIASMVVHILVCVANFINKEERKKKFYRLKWITGILMLLFMTVHGDDYVKDINFLGIHITKGIVTACIEIAFLIISTLHIRISVGAMCDHLGLDDKRKLIIGRVSCGIATLMILVPGTIIWQYFV